VYLVVALFALMPFRWSGLRFACQAKRLLVHFISLTLLAEGAGWMYLGKQDDSQFQPNYLYLPLLAHSGGIGGVGSSERLL
jgi:hypothetical protein